MLGAKSFVATIKKKAKEDQEKLRESLKSGLSTIQKECMESNDNVASKLVYLKKHLAREQLLNENVIFTTKTLSQFDDIDPPVLDIIFEYKLKDVQYQENEAKEIARLFKSRDLDPDRKVIHRIEREIVSK